MVITNTLLSISFCLVSNFAKTIDVPGGLAPKSTEQLQRFVCGSPFDPTHVILVATNGSEYWIQQGGVYRFASQQSYRCHPRPITLEDSSSLLLNSNQVVALATEVVERLRKTGSTSPKGGPIVAVLAATESGGAAAYAVKWSRYATLEINAHTGQVTFVDLYDESFFDLDLAQSISNRVCVVETPPFQLTSKPPRPRPTAKQVEEALRSWLALCARLGIDPGVNTNLAAVDWEETYCYTNRFRAENDPVCDVRFATGVAFQSVQGLVFYLEARDACYVGDWGSEGKAYFSKFRGIPTKSWDDLAREFTGTLVARIGLPKKLVDSLEPRPVAGSLEAGVESIKRVLIQWRLKSSDWAERDIEFVMAEFDSETGEVKMLSFCGPKICEAYRLGMARREP